MKRIFGALVGLVFLTTSPVIAQQDRDTTEVILVAPDTLEIRRNDLINRVMYWVIAVPGQDTLPVYQDTLPVYQDTLPVYQDTIPVFQDTIPPVTLPPVQDTLPPIVLPPVQDTLPPFQDTIPGCVCDTIPVPPDTIPEPDPETHIISVTQDSTLINGNLNVVEGSWSIHLDRSDGTWAAFDQLAAPEVDSVYICSSGVCNRERRLPYELEGGRVDLLLGSYDIYWEVFGTEPDSGRVVITVTGAPGVPDPEPEPDPDPEPTPPELTDKLGALFDLHRTGPFPTMYTDLYDYWQPIHRDRQEAQGSNGWAQTYYDRGFAAYGMNVTGQGSQYLEAGDYSVLQYRDDYVLPNDGGVAPRWAFPEGLAAHALMTNDPQSVRAVFRIADKMSHWIDGKDSIPTTRYLDGRIQGRAILSQQMAYLVTGVEHYAGVSQRGVDDLVRWFDMAGGTGRWDSNAWGNTLDDPGAYCGGMSTFNVAHALLYALIRHHQLIGPVPRLNEILTASLDFSWTHWYPGEGFAYIQPPIESEGTTFICDAGSDNPGRDLTLLISTAYRYGHYFTGESRFLAMAEEVEAYGLSGSVQFPTIFMSGNKQFNQSFYRTWKFITTSK